MVGLGNPNGPDDEGPSKENGKRLADLQAEVGESGEELAARSEVGPAGLEDPEGQGIGEGVLDPTAQALTLGFATVSDASEQQEVDSRTGLLALRSEQSDSQYQRRPHPEYVEQEKRDPQDESLLNEWRHPRLAEQKDACHCHGHPRERIDVAPMVQHRSTSNRDRLYGFSTH